MLPEAKLFFFWFKDFVFKLHIQGWEYEGRRERSAPNFLFAPLTKISNKKKKILRNTRQDKQQENANLFHLSFVELALPLWAVKLLDCFLLHHIYYICKLHLIRYYRTAQFGVAESERLKS